MIELVNAAVFEEEGVDRMWTRLERTIKILLLVAVEETTDRAIERLVRKRKDALVGRPRKDCGGTRYGGGEKVYRDLTEPGLRSTLLTQHASLRLTPYLRPVGPWVEPRSDRTLPGPRLEVLFLTP